MQIALVTDGMWPYVLGGMQKHSYYLCKYLAANRVSVDVYHYNNSALPIEELQYFSPEERKFIRSYVLQFPAASKFPGHYLYDSYRYSREVSRQLYASGRTYDFIYTKGFSGWSLILQKTRHGSGMPPVGVNFHGYEMFQKPPGLKSFLQYVLLLRRPVKNLSRRADLVFSYGGKVTSIIKRLGVPRSRILEVPTGVEASTVADGIMPSSDITRFVFLGRYERRKGIEELNKAILLLDPSFRKKAEFHFIGPVPGNKKIPGCIYHGKVMDADRLRRLLRGCDILVCPSWSEGMPNVILEAMSQGLAIIATNTGATSTMVHQGTGWLLPWPEPLLLKKTIESAVTMSRHELDEKKHRGLRLLSAEFVWEKIGPRFIEQLRQVLFS